MLQIYKKERKIMREKNVEIYTNETCPGCINIKRWFQQMNIPYVERQIHRDITLHEFYDLFPDAKYVPYIVYENEHIDIEDVESLRHLGDHHGNNL